MVNTNLGDIFVRERLCKVLTEIKELNISKIDRDIALILDGTDFEEIFNNNPKEIEAKLNYKVMELNMLIVCAKKGFDYFYKNELPKYKKYLSEKDYEETVKNFETVLECVNIALEEEAN
jgi:hypothetical protein